MTVPQQLSKRQFADHIGVKPSYIRQLELDGRLVMAPGGRSVLVAESVARIAATRDPAHQAVADRHAAARGAPALTGHAAGDDAAEEPDASGDSSTGPQYDFQSAKAKREHWAAEREHAAFRKEAGELIERSEHVAVFAAAGAELRGKLEAWAAVLPPQLVGRDEAAIRATLADQVEQVLRSMSDAIAKMAPQQGGAHA